MRKIQLIVFLISALVLSSFHLLHIDKEKEIEPIQITAAFQHSLLLHNNKIWFWGQNQDFEANQRDLIEPTLVVNLSELAAISEGASSKHILAIKKDKTVWAWGQNTYGQLASVTSDYESFPLKISGLDDIIQVATGKGHSVALKADGTVWTWGWNKNGQLGLGHHDNRSEVQQVPNLYHIVAISAGAKHTLALDENGDVWSWGANHLGQLGLGKAESTTRPEKIEGLRDIQQISAGAFHNIALAKDGKMFTWGWNDFGQVGNNTNANCRVPVYIPLNDIKTIKAGTLHNIALKTDGTVWTWGSNSFKQCGASKANLIKVPQQIEVLKNITSLSAGDIHSLAMDGKGNVWTWGNDGNGRLGRKKTIDDEPAIAFNLNSLKEEVVGTVSKNTKTLRSIGSLEVFGLKHRKASDYNEFSVEDYIIDTMYYIIKIGDDTLSNQCPTERALKKLDIRLKSRKDNTITLLWKLSEEDDLYLDYFTEKSTDGVSWKELDEDLEILQVSDFETQFIIRDSDTNFLSNFYRLGHLDCDENNVYSNIIRVDRRLNQTEGFFASKFTVFIKNPTKKKIAYQIQDIDGNILKKKMFEDKEIAFTDGFELKDGAYFMFLIDEDLHNIIDSKKITKISK